MKLRVGAMVGQIVEGIAVDGHVPFDRREDPARHAELVGLKSDFTILDVDDHIAC